MYLLTSFRLTKQYVRNLISINNNEMFSSIPPMTKRYISTSKGKQQNKINENCNEATEQSTSNATMTNNVSNNSQIVANNHRPNNIIPNEKKKYKLVPKVPTTEYISISDIETEGLFAGYRPLFLGKSTLQGSEYISKYDTNSMLTSLSNSKLVDIITTSLDNPEKTAKLEELLAEIKNGEYDESAIKGPKSSERKTPIVPWDASIGGMVYPDDPFRNVPKKIVSQLKPFEPLAKENSKQENNDVSNSMIVMKVHNPRINDDLEMVNLFDKDSTDKKSFYKKYNNNRTNLNAFKLDFKKIAKQRKAFNTENKKIAYDHKFINDDQHILRSEIKTLLNYLSDVFYEQSGLTVYADTKTCVLPLHAYIELTKSSGRANRRFFRKTIIDQIFPIYNTILATYESPTDIEKFKRLTLTKINQSVKNLSQSIPSVCFTDSSKSVDCLIRSSPVPGFKRMYWLKPTKRHYTFWGHNSSKEYSLRLKQNESITRNGVRYMRYPNYINWRNVSDAFDNWDYFTRL
ncbi:similar to Saccharomyces cerevisiae YNL295W Putative protein of unknown function [Maudiozyma saulgeensis]|uniref:Uncharacterized protein n=1 Tax=Maudiozyma saulgeensis TaxID=1789683 RepID=A0A1X7R2P5_9SACH|nr:similar to Saccharomyces cerevisiae YNL295W Putative protein of unknown function [Kazachstania saulgeensis]